MSALTPGNIFVPSDIRDATQGDAAEFTTTGTFVQTLSGFPYSTAGAILPSGIFILSEENIVSGYLAALNIYTSIGTLIIRFTTLTTNSPNISWTAPMYGWVDPITHIEYFFFFADQANGANVSCRLYKIKTDGTVVQNWLLPGNAQASRSIAISPDGSKLYYTRAGSGYPIRVYDLVNNIQLTDLVVADINVNWYIGMIVRNNGELIVIGFNALNPEQFIRRYSTSGVLLQEYTLDVEGYERGELFSDTDDNFVRVRTFPDVSGATSKFWHLNLNTATSTTFTINTLEGTGSVPSTCPNLFLRNGSIIIPPEPEVPSPSGLYFINPLKATRHDSYYNSIEKKIPNPTVKTGLLGE